MSDEDLEAVYDLGEGYGFVFLPLIDGSSGFDEDDEIFILALKVDFRYGLVAFHLACSFECSVCVVSALCDGVVQRPR